VTSMTEESAQGKKKRKKRNKKKKRGNAEGLSEVSVNDQSLDDRSNTFMDESMEHSRSNSTNTGARNRRL
jgi:hypothetical protein